EDVEIKDIAYGEFVNLLKLIHPQFTLITDDSVSHILKLSDRFQMEGVIDQSEHFLQTVSNFYILKKMILANQYHLKKLMNGCLQSIKCVYVLNEITSTREYTTFSNATKAAICDRMKDLILPWNCTTHNPIDRQYAMGHCDCQPVLSGFVI
ncbi:hypothetical protein PMAYCL1PPCAC_25983, partial [Pristionchus mayeri]